STSLPNKDQSRAHLKLYFSKVGSIRKPYIVQADGLASIKVKLSPVRAIINLVLFLDLQSRSNGRGGVASIHDAIISAYYSIINPEDIENLKNIIRVAIYRFETAQSNGIVLESE